MRGKEALPDTACAVLCILSLWKLDQASDLLLEPLKDDSALIG
jgi:hypothetical protein